MTRATFNGVDALVLPGGASLHGAIEDSSRELVVWADTSSGVRLWGPIAVEIGPDPRAIHTRSNALDFLVVHWAAPDVVVLTGAKQAVVLDRATGSVKATVPVEFIGKSSLDIAGLRELPDGRLLIVSTKRVSLLATDLSVEFSRRLSNPLASDPEIIGSNEIVLRLRDLTGPPGAIVEEHLPL